MTDNFGEQIAEYGEDRHGCSDGVSSDGPCSSTWSAIGRTMSQ